jgi:hypothetical protein
MAAGVVVECLAAASCYYYYAASLLLLTVCVGRRGVYCTTSMWYRHVLTKMISSLNREEKCVQ